MTSREALAGGGEDSPTIWITCLDLKSADALDQLGPVGAAWLQRAVCGVRCAVRGARCAVRQDLPAPRWHESGPGVSGLFVQLSAPGRSDRLKGQVPRQVRRGRGDLPRRVRGTALRALTAADSLGAGRCVDAARRFRTRAGVWSGSHIEPRTPHAPGTVFGYPETIRRSCGGCESAVDRASVLHGTGVSPTQVLITSATPRADIGLCHLMGRHAELHILQPDAFPLCRRFGGNDSKEAEKMAENTGVSPWRVTCTGIG